ncbi:MAG: adenylyl-sulfate kinase [Candidatus Peribacteraceae bacterium]|nr:adenylyl-sulfate kinase [Candidatus Peribacteraceae bacterium]
MAFPIYWLTGNTDAGKTTLAFGALDYINHHLDCNSPFARRAIVLDGDDMRDPISTNETMSPEDRRKHNLRVARLAKLLSEQGHLVIVAVIAPFEEVRQEIDNICSPLWIHVQRSMPTTNEKPYEAPKQPDFVIDNDRLAPETAQNKFIDFITYRNERDIQKQ